MMIIFIFCLLLCNFDHAFVIPRIPISFKHHMRSREISYQQKSRILTYPIMPLYCQSITACYKKSLPLSSYQKGEKYNATIISVVAFGVFVKVDSKTSVMLPRSVLGEDSYRKLKLIEKDDIIIEIIEVDTSKNRLTGTCANETFTGDRISAKLSAAAAQAVSPTPIPSDRRMDRYGRQTNPVTKLGYSDYGERMSLDTEGKPLFQDRPVQAIITQFDVDRIHVTVDEFNKTKGIITEEYYPSYINKHLIRQQYKVGDQILTKIRRYVDTTGNETLLLDANIPLYRNISSSKYLEGIIEGVHPNGLLIRPANFDYPGFLHYSHIPRELFYILNLIDGNRINLNHAGVMHLFHKGDVIRCRIEKEDPILQTLFLTALRQHGSKAPPYQRLLDYWPRLGDSSGNSYVYDDTEDYDDYFLHTDMTEYRNFNYSLHMRGPSKNYYYDPTELMIWLNNKPFIHIYQEYLQQKAIIDRNTVTMAPEVYASYVEHHLSTYYRNKRSSSTGKESRDSIKNTEIGIQFSQQMRLQRRDEIRYIYGNMTEKLSNPGTLHFLLCLSLALTCCIDTVAVGLKEIEERMKQIELARENNTFASFLPLRSGNYIDHPENDDTLIQSIIYHEEEWDPEGYIPKFIPPRRLQVSSQSRYQKRESLQSSYVESTQAFKLDTFLV